jgi:hypothetical protein
MIGLGWPIGASFFIEVQPGDAADAGPPYYPALDD